MKTFVYIVIDQLGWCDRDGLPGLSKLLSRPRCLATPYFPTVTETAHASIGIAGLPEVHGIIGDETFQRHADGLQRITLSGCEERLYCPGGFVNRPSLLESLSRKDIQTIVVAGKKKVARLLDPRPERYGPGIRVTLSPGEIGERLVYQILDEAGEAGPPSWNLDSIRAPLSLKEPGTDCSLLDMTRLLLSNARDPGKNAFVFIGLPQMDALGHSCGRKDEMFTNALSELDEALCDFLRWLLNGAIEDTAVVVTGDHGCRPVSKAVWSNEEGHLLSLVRGGNVKKIPMPNGVDTYTDIDGKEHPAIIFDGGTMRIWAKQGCVEDVIRTFDCKKWKEFIASVINATDLSFSVRKGESSLHRHWGDVVCFANSETALCKEHWLSGETLVPIGEHGTDFDNDRLVPLWGTEYSHHEIVKSVMAHFEDSI